MERHSTSPSCGNLVDGLPHDCHTETVAKPGRLGPAQNDEPMQNFIELSMFWWWPWIKPKEKFVERILKINRNMIKCKKDNTRARLMGFQISGKIDKIENYKKNLDFLKISNFKEPIGKWDEKCDGWRGTLRVLRAETWLTVYRTIALRKQWLSRADLGPHKMMN